MLALIFSILSVKKLRKCSHDSVEMYRAGPPLNKSTSSRFIAKKTILGLLASTLINYFIIQ